MQLTVATADTGRLAKAAMFGLDGIWRDSYLHKNAGVIFAVLVKAGAVQGSLFLHPTIRAARRWWPRSTR